MPSSVIAPVPAKHYTGLLDPVATTVALESQSITITSPITVPYLDQSKRSAESTC